MWGLPKGRKQLAANIDAALAEVDTNAGEENEEIKPIGKGIFGNIYDQFKGKVKAAFDSSRFITSFLISSSITR